MNESRPSSFTVEYNGSTIEFTRLEENGGYGFACPKCRALRGKQVLPFNWIDTDSGTRHGLSFDEQGRAMLKGSILCRTRWKKGPECGWHVIIEHGVARDV